jgi:ribosome-associated protein
MPRKKKQEPLALLTEAITGALADKKAKSPVIMDFREMTGSVCDLFIICHGTSRTQVEAIADHVIAEVKKQTGLNPAHVEGSENAEWILIDYFDVVVHVFQEDRRRFYNIEQLWGDAKITRMESSD